MADPVKLVWVSVRDLHTGKVDAGVGTAYDEDVPVGKVSLASGDPQNRSLWRWTMFAYGRHARSPTGLQRFGSAATKDQAKADCERTDLELTGFVPGTGKQSIITTWRCRRWIASGARARVSGARWTRSGGYPSSAMFQMNATSVTAASPPEGGPSLTKRRGLVSAKKPAGRSRRARYKECS
jgi:hypothetical protein